MPTPLPHNMQYYIDLLEELREIDLANQIGSLLGWDQEVIMPKNGASSRAEHLAWISKTVHEKISNPRIGELIASLENEDLDEIQAANVRISKKMYERATCLSLIHI